MGEWPGGGFVSESSSKYQDVRSGIIVAGLAAAEVVDSSYVIMEKSTQITSVPRNNILFIGAHPDDVELGCLGTIRLYLKKNDNVFVIIATDGERGNKKLGKNNRVNESIVCLERTGLPTKNIILLHFPDTRLSEYKNDILARIEEFCFKNKIDSLYVGTNKDYHQDHAVLFEETIRASRNVRNVLAYESNSSTFSSFSPNFFVNITDFIDEKAEFLKLHISQCDKNYMGDEVVKSLARFRGNQSKSVSYAEAFEVFRMVAEE